MGSFGEKGPGWGGAEGGEGRRRGGRGRDAAARGGGSCDRCRQVCLLGARLRTGPVPRLAEQPPPGPAVAGLGGEPRGEGAPSLARERSWGPDPEAGKHSPTLLWRPAALLQLVLSMLWPNRTFFLGAKYTSFKSATHHL